MSFVAADIMEVVIGSQRRPVHPVFSVLLPPQNTLLRHDLKLCKNLISLLFTGI